MPDRSPTRPIEVLLVEDNPADVDLIREQLEESRMLLTLRVATDGARAEQYLRREGEFADAPRPDLVMMDLNLPRRSGTEVLANMKASPDLRAIPVVILTSSDAEQDIVKSYTIGANCYITKPVTLEGLRRVVATVEDFWLTIVRLPDYGGAR